MKSIEWEVEISYRLIKDLLMGIPRKCSTNFPEDATLTDIYTKSGNPSSSVFVRFVSPSNPYDRAEMQRCAVWHGIGDYK